MIELIEWNFIIVTGENVTGLNIEMEKINGFQFNFSLNPSFLEFTSESLYFKANSEEIINFESVNIPIAVIRQAIGSAFIRLVWTSTKM